MNSTLLDGMLGLPDLFDVLVYDTKPVNFILMCCNTIKWIQKTRKVYDPEKIMARDAHFLCLNVNDSYNG